MAYVSIVRETEAELAEAAAVVRNLAIGLRDGKLVRDATNPQFAAVSRISLDLDKIFGAMEDSRTDLLKAAEL